MELWTFNNTALFEIDVFHHCPTQYDSWADFLNDKKALSCNCIYGNPLLYWYWDNNWENDHPDDFSNEEQFKFDKVKENFKRVVLIYLSWGSGMAKINITVTPDDEPSIRSFLFDVQSSQRVQI